MHLAIDLENGFIAGLNIKNPMSAVKLMESLAKEIRNMTVKQRQSLKYIEIYRGKITVEYGDGGSK